MSTSEGTVLSGRSRRGVRLLSIDGGGIRGLSTIIILQELMRQIQERHRLPTLPKPCEIFDLASGIGTGGLIVIMLFRLEMTIDQAIGAYLGLAKHVFSERKWLWWQEETFKASRLEEAIIKLIMDASGLDKIKAKELRMSKEEGPKSFVCTISADGVSSPALFRTWNSPGNTVCDCTIVEAARATCAAPAIFKGIDVGAESINPRGLGCSNPTEYAVQEAASAFPLGDISCILSLGTGAAVQIGPDTRFTSRGTLPRNLIHILRQMATDCEDRSQSITQRFPDIQNSYFRINLASQDPLLEEWRRVNDVKIHTKSYLGGKDIVGQLVEVLADSAVVEPTDQSVSGSAMHPTPDSIAPPIQPFELPHRATRQLDSRDASPEKVDDVDVAQKHRRKVAGLGGISAGRKNILSIDGGGFRGYACLLILYQLMRQLTTNPDDPVPCPCQVFDLICGTSTGGLIAVLLGRLGLDCITAMNVYLELGASLFGGLDEKAWNSIIDRSGLASETFEKKLAAIVEKYTGSKDTLLKIQKTRPDKVNHKSTNIFVTTVEPAGASSAEPYRLRSYTTPPRGVQPTIGDHAWTICEVVCATTASPSYLKPLKIGSQSFQDAGNSGSANPVWDALKEAELRWSKSAEPVIISLGTGLASLLPVDSNLEEEDLSERYYEPVSSRVQVGTKAPKSKLWSDEFAKQLIRVAQDTELKHQEATKHFGKRKLANNYFRFNPSAGAGNIDMSDVAQVRMIAAITNAWLKMPEVYDLMDRACQAIKESLAVLALLDGPTGKFEGGQET